MLSVQAPGCAGMERLGAPGGAAPPPERPRLRRDPLDHREREELARGQQLLQREVGRLLERQARARSAAAADLLALPPHLALPDGERGDDAHLQLRVAYQQAELTRSSIQPPPNKTVSDVPEWAASGPPPRRTAPAKKDGIVQKAVRYLSRMGAGGAAPGAARSPPSALLQQLGANELAMQRLQRELEAAPRPAPAPAPGAPCVMVPLAVARPPSPRAAPLPAPPHELPPGHV